MTGMNDVELRLHMLAAEHDGTEEWMLDEALESGLSLAECHESDHELDRGHEHEPVEYLIEWYSHILVPGARLEGRGFDEVAETVYGNHILWATSTSQAMDKWEKLDSLTCFEASQLMRLVPTGENDQVETQIFDIDTLPEGWDFDTIEVIDCQVAVPVIAGFTAELLADAMEHPAFDAWRDAEGRDAFDHLRAVDTVEAGRIWMDACNLFDQRHAEPAVEV